MPIGQSDWQSGEQYTDAAQEFHGKYLFTQAACSLACSVVGMQFVKRENFIL